MKSQFDRNQLPTEVKIKIVNAQTLVDEARKVVQNREYYFDLTSKWQLKSDCKEVEKQIRLISDGNVSEKAIKNLEVAVVKLQTTLNGLIQFYSR